MGRIGSRLNAYKNGRSVVMILISSVGFINNAYQLSPNIVALLGLVLYLYALQRSHERPGISTGLMALGLILLSINFTAQFIGVALLLLGLLPLCHRNWRAKSYALTAVGGTLLFALFFISYAWQLNKVDHSFYLIWKHKYTNFYSFNPQTWLSNAGFYGQMMLWYLIPGWFLLLWTIYRRRKVLWGDEMIFMCCLLAILLVISAIVSNRQDETALYPLVIPIVLLASLEIDSMRISVVSLLNWFGLFTFGLAGICVITLYIALNFGHPVDLLAKAQFYAPNYVFQFNFWQLFLAVVISAIWIFMITRKHIRGRELVSNWASGTTFVLVVFVSLCLPWFNDVLSFQAIVESSKVYLDRRSDSCVATNGVNHVQSALWYYYADVRLTDVNSSEAQQCKQMLLAIDNNQVVNYPSWQVIWSAKRPVDLRRYVLFQRR
jgi:hypothetical protein